MICHGGNFVEGSAKWDGGLATWLEAQGMNPVRFEYADGDGETTIDSCGNAVEAAIESAPRGHDVALIGVSSGGLWAACGCRHPRVKCVVILAGVLDPSARWEAVPLTDVSKPFFRVPVSVKATPEAMANALSSTAIEMLQIRGATRGDVHLFTSTSDEKSPPRLYLHHFDGAMGVTNHDIPGATHKDICTPSESTMCLIRDVIRGSSRK